VLILHADCVPIVGPGDIDARIRSSRSVARLRPWRVHRTIALPTACINVPTGVMVVSTPELTALNLANRPDDGGGLHNVATVLMDLVSPNRIDVEKLAHLAHHFPRAAGRRLGWLLETFTGIDPAGLAEAAAGGGDEPSALDPHGRRLGRVDRWRLRLNTSVEPDR
jgi:predicted transcriptional regulator of viral defense system